MFRLGYKDESVHRSPLLQSKPVLAAEFTKWASHTADVPMQRARRLVGKTALGRSTLFSSITLPGASYERSADIKLCYGYGEHRFACKRSRRNGRCSKPARSKFADVGASRA